MAKKTDDMFYELRGLDSLLAADLLSTADMGDTNTSAYRDKVAFYADTIRSGLWRLNGDTVVVSEKGKLLDGRARLMACVEAGVPFPAIVVRNVGENALISIDTHVKRSAKDILTVRSHKFPSAIASALPLIVSYANAPDRAYWRPHGATDLTTLDIALLADAHEEISECARFVSDFPFRKMGLDLTPATATAAYWMLSRADEAKTKRFFELLASPDVDDPAVLPLQRRLRDKEHHRANTAILAIIVKAWNRFYVGRSIAISKLTWDGIVERIGGTANSEPFPAIAGDPDIQPFDLAGLRAKDGVQIVNKSAASIVKGSRIRIRRILVTVAMAHRFLERNGPMDRNRSVRKAHVKKLAEDMAAGRWVFNGKPLKFSKDGVLLDGQHRCYACILSEVPFETLVIEGLEESDFATYDQGRRQGAGIQMARVGRKYGRQHAACATTLWRIEKGLHGGEPSPTVAMEYIERHPELAESIQMLDGHKHIVQTGISGALHVLFSKVDKRQADDFMTQLCKGINLPEGSPVLELRRKFIEQTTRKVALPRHAETVSRIIQTWNAWRGRPQPEFKITDTLKYPEIL